MKKDLLLSPDRPALRPFVESLPEAFSQGGEVIYSQRNEVRVFDVEGTRLVVKRYKRPNFIQRFTCSLGRRSKGRRAYLYAQRLLGMGVCTPEPIASVDCYDGWMYEQGYFASSEINWPSCMVLRDDPALPVRRQLISALADFLVSLHEQGFLHGDTNLSNFLYQQDGDGRFHFAVIDVNRSRFVDRPAKRSECVHNLTRLSHVRPLLVELLAAYAERRGWDVEAFTAEVMTNIRHFEQRWVFYNFMRGRWRKKKS